MPEAELPERELPEAELPEAELPERELPERELPEAELPERESPAAEFPAAELPELDPALEPVEEIDESGRVVRVVPRAVMRVENLLHRMVAVVVIRSDDRIVVHQRADWKDVHPSKWDVAFGGVPNVGESDLAAAARELSEEAGLDIGGASDVDGESLIDLASLESSDQHTKWVGRFFLTICDEPLTPADGEVAQFDEIAFADLEAWAAATPLCDDTSAVVLPMLLERLPRLQ